MADYFSPTVPQPQIPLADITPMTKRYNHLYVLAFSFESTDPTGERLHPTEIRQAILTRLASLDDTELHEAIGLPDDTYEVTEPAAARMNAPAPKEEEHMPSDDG